MSAKGGTAMGNTTEERRSYPVTLRIIANILRDAGLDVVMDAANTRAVWSGASGPMEAVEFDLAIDCPGPNRLNDPLVATAIGMIDHSLDGHFTNIYGPWGVYRYPAGRNERETGIQLQITSRTGDVWSEWRPTFTPEELKVWWAAIKAASDREDPREYILAGG